MAYIEGIDITQIGTIAVARPLVELQNHVTHCKCPSLSLLIRSVKVIASAIICGRQHYCDYITIHGDQWVRHNLKGKIACTEDLETFKKEHPFMFESSLFFSFKFPNPWNTVYMDHFESLDVLSAQTISDFYREKFDYSITEKETGNQIQDILSSPNLEPLGKKWYYEPDPNDRKPMKVKEAILKE